MWDTPEPTLGVAQMLHIRMPALPKVSHIYSLQPFRLSEKTIVPKTVAIELSPLIMLIYGFLLCAVSTVAMNLI